MSLCRDGIEQGHSALVYINYNHNNSLLDKHKQLKKLIPHNSKKCVFHEVITSPWKSSVRTSRSLHLMMDLATVPTDLVSVLTIFSTKCRIVPFRCLSSGSAPCSAGVQELALEHHGTLSVSLAVKSVCSLLRIV